MYRTDHKAVNSKLQFAAITVPTAFIKIIKLIKQSKGFPGGTVAAIVITAFRFGIVQACSFHDSTTIS